MQVSKQDIVNCNLSLEQDPINGRRYNITIAIMEEEEEEDDNEEDTNLELGLSQNNTSAKIEDTVASAIMQAMQSKQNP